MSSESNKYFDYLVHTVQECRKAGAHIYSVNFCSMLGEGYLLNEQCEKTKQEAGLILKLAEEMGMKFYAAWCSYLLGEISLKTDPTQQMAPSAEACFENAISICREIKAENHPALAYAGLGRHYKRQGSVAPVRDYLDRALEIFERLGTLLEPDKVREELSQLPEA